MDVEDVPFEGTRILSDLFRSFLGVVEILERIVAVDVKGSGFDCEIDGEFRVVEGGEELTVVWGVGASSGPFLYLRDLRMDANLSNPSFVPALE